MALARAIIVGGGVETAGDPMRFATPDSESLVQTEILGRTVIAQMNANLKGAVESVSVICGNQWDDFSSSIAPDSSQIGYWDCVLQQLLRWKHEGVETVLIACVGAYVEFDAAAMIDFHRREGKALTRAFCKEMALDIWALELAQCSEDADVSAYLKSEDAAYYGFHGYVNRLEAVRDMRRLVVDGLTAQCRFRPIGFEVKPGVWIAPGAQVEKSARIVAPAYVGPGVRISEDCLITRFTNVECNSEVDYGTAVEDSSILANTYVGIGLDLSHSVARGNELFNLQHEVKLRISDPAVMRKSKVKSDKDRHGTQNFMPEEMAMLSAKDDGAR